VPNEWTRDAEGDIGLNQPVYEIPVTAAEIDPVTGEAIDEPLPWYLQDPADSPPVEPVPFKSRYDVPTDTVMAFPTHAESARTVADIELTPELAPDLTRSALDPADSSVLRPRRNDSEESARSRRAQRAVASIPADQDILDALQEVLDLDGSDLHVTVGAPPNIRVNGALRPLDNTNRWMRDKVRSALYSLLTPAQTVEFERELELDFAYTANGARFRVNSTSSAALSAVRSG
jgi:hypothetical protein